MKSVYQNIGKQMKDKQCIQSFIDKELKMKFHNYDHRFY